MRLSELYTSIQGEGLRVGTPVQFVRFAGCNLRCPGWPCDSQFAIDPKLYRKDWLDRTPSELMGETKPWPKSLCLTGGEPFIQHAADLEEYCRMALAKGYFIEVFTNGTIPYPDWALKNLSFIMDWKLPGSGEDPANEMRHWNLERLNHKDAVKFVCRDYDDYRLAKEYAEIYIDPIVPIRRPVVYFGAVFGVLPEKQLATWMMRDELPYLLNVQVHNYVFGATTRRT